MGGGKSGGISNAFSGGGQNAYGDMAKNLAGMGQQAQQQAGQQQAQTSAAMNPWTSGGANWLNEYQNALNGMSNPQQFYQQMMNGYQTSPQAQQQIQQGITSANAAGAASGMLGSGAEQTALQKQGQQIVDADQQNWLNNMMGIHNQYLGGLGNLQNQSMGANEWTQGQNNQIAGQAMQDQMQAQQAAAQAQAQGQMAGQQGKNSAMGKLGSLGSLGASFIPGLGGMGKGGGFGGSVSGLPSPFQGYKIMMNGQFGAMTPLGGFTSGANAINDMLQKYQQMQMQKLLTQNEPRKLRAQNLNDDLANQTDQLNLNALPELLKQKILGGNLDNQTAQMNLNYLPQLNQQKLQGGNLDNQFMRLKIAAAQQAAANPAGAAMQSAQGKITSDLMKLTQVYGANSPQVKAFVAQVRGLNTSGMQPQASGFQIGHNGFEVVKTDALGGAGMGGGDESSDDNQLSQEQIAEQGGQEQQDISPTYAGGLVASPLGKPGTTLWDPTTGAAVMAPERSTAAQAQQQMAAEGPISETVQSLYSDIAPVLGSGGAGGAAGKLFKQAQAAFMGASPEMQRYNVAVNNKIPMAVEGILSATNLPKTNESIKLVHDALMPKTGVTPEEYKLNLATTLAQLELKNNANKNLLKGGVQLSGAGKKESLGELTNHFSDLLDGTIVPENENVGGFDGKQINAYAKKTGKTAAEVIAMIKAKQGGQ